MSTIESNVPNNLFVLKHKDLDVAMVAIDLTSGKIEHVLATYLPKDYQLAVVKIVQIAYYIGGN